MTKDQVIDGISPSEFTKYTDEVLSMGALKYGRDTWKYGQHFNYVDNCISIIRHSLRALYLSEDEIGMLVFQIRSNINLEDKKRFAHALDTESNLHHFKHIATRGSMGAYYVEHKLGEFNDD